MNLDIQPLVEVDTDDMTGADLGGLLRASRLRRGDDLRQVANALRIRYVYLEAIEEGRFDVLPGKTYTNGFIRTYAEYLGLDGEQIVRRLNLEGVVSTNEAELRFPTVIPDNGIPGSAIVMFGLVIALLGYGSWYFVFTPDVFVSEVAPLVSHDLVKSAQTDRRNLAPIAQNPLVEPSSANAASAKLLTENEKNIEKHKEPTADVNAKSELAEEIPQNAKTASPSENLTGTTAMSVNPRLAPVSESNSSGEPNRKFASQEISQVRQEESTATDSNNGEANGTRTSLAQADIEPTRYPDAKKIAEANQPIGEVLIKAKNAEDRTLSMVIEPSLVQAALDDSAPDTLSKLPDRKNNEAVPFLDATSGVNPQDRVDEEVASVLETNTQSNLSNRPDEKVLSVPDVTSGSSLTDRIDEEGTSIANVETGASNEEKKANSPNTPMVRMETPQITRITLTAKDASWIQVRDINANQLILSKVLLKGHSYQVPNKQGLSLMTGNAGALEIAVNGEIVPAIGNLGEVRKKVLLEAERLRQGKAVVE